MTMSAKTDALERAVTDLIQARTAADAAPGPRARARIDHAFARLAALAAPRIRYFIRRYGLADAAEDAQQACAIALHRAAEHYDPRRARFTTYVNWQIRAELQALRQRLHGGQGRADTLSLDALGDGDGEDWLVDTGAQDATERAAADRLAALCADRLVAEWATRRRSALRPARSADKLAAERALVRRQLSGADHRPGCLSERDRHIVRRALADMARHSKPH